MNVLEQLMHEGRHKYGELSCEQPCEYWLSGLEVIELFTPPSIDLFISPPVRMSNTKLIDLIIQGPWADSELISGIFLHPQAFFKDSQNQIFFLFCQ
jgi:hypothetical protein